MHKYLLLLSLSLLPSPALAHDHNDLGDLIEIQQVMLSVMTTYLTTPTDGFDDMGTISFRDQKVPVNISAMKQLAALAAFYDSSEAHHCHSGCQTKWTKKALKIFGKLVSLPYRAAKKAIHPVQTVKELRKILRKGTRHGVSTISQYYHGYSSALFIVIIASQAAWEALESVVLQGVHLACTVFNSALLTVTTISERLIQLASFPATDIAFKKRFLKSISGIKGDLIMNFRSLKNTSYSLEQSTTTISSENYKPKHQTMLQLYLRSNGFYDSVYVSREKSLGSRQVQLSDDIDFVFDPNQNQSERFFVGLNLINGLRKQIKLSQNIGSSLSDQNAISLKHLWEINKATGYSRANTALLTNSLLLISSLDGEDLPLHLKSKIKRALEHQLLLFQDLAELFSKSVARTKDNTMVTDEYLSQLADKVSQRGIRLKYYQSYLRAGKRPLRKKIQNGFHQICLKIFQK